MDIPSGMDTTLFGLDMDNCSPLLPFSRTPVTYPLDNYVDGFTASFNGLDAAVDPSNFGSLGSFDSLPLLPPIPPPDSPPTMALPAASEEGAIVPKLRRHCQEVDEADILPENSKRTRAPSTRKRCAADEVIPDQSQKKGKRKA
ncbi:hypothetical protein K438DRAFT_1989137 [Mycena galopus ATCC 62051]|nr:hypothetical protein K438DRAFT_1989137 [Mycena galopus ATCC 62051]